MLKYKVTSLIGLKVAEVKAVTDSPLFQPYNTIHSKAPQSTSIFSCEGNYKFCDVYHIVVSVCVGLLPSKQTVKVKSVEFYSVIDKESLQKVNAKIMELSNLNTIIIKLSKHKQLPGASRSGRSQ